MPSEVIIAQITTGHSRVHSRPLIRVHAFTKVHTVGKQKHNVGNDSVLVACAYDRPCLANRWVGCARLCCVRTALARGRGPRQAYPHRSPQARVGPGRLRLRETQRSRANRLHWSGVVSAVRSNHRARCPTWRAQVGACTCAQVVQKGGGKCSHSRQPTCNRQRR